ncbi:MAG: hypothetical protein HC877_00965 [Thioploca sp.]|nr:hypothetical protein [Thioploca sp.]
MLSLRFIFLLMLYCCYLGKSFANELEQVTPVTVKNPQPLWLAEKFESRRRGLENTPPKIWAINIHHYRDFCYLTPEEIVLWLPEDNRSGQLDRLIIKEKQTQREIKLRWLAHETTLAWPNNRLPIQPGHTYLIKLGDASEYNEIIVHQIPLKNQTIAGQIQWMKQQGCDWQAEMLLEKQTA